jgi:cold shock CspA family protein
MLEDKLLGFLDFWYAPKNYGFVYSGEAKYFVHISAIVSGKPQTGASVRFTPGTTRRGQVALNVEVLGAVR